MKVTWTEHRQPSEHGEIVDVIGKLGPLRAFTLAQAVQKREWELCSHFIPSKHRGKTFRSIEDGKRTCERIVADFSDWLAK